MSPESEKKNQDLKREIVPIKNFVEKCQIIDFKPRGSP
jgi:hypothetical protein